MFTSSHSRRVPRVVVVGAGPAGSACALELRRHHTAEVILLDRSTYPRRKVCGSGLSPLALTQLRHLDMLDALADVHLEMNGLHVVGPSGAALHLRGARGAWVVPRTELDHRLVRAAVREGVRFVEGVRVVDIVADTRDQPAVVRTRDRTFEADIVVIATGSPSTFELDDHPRDGIRTIMGWWQGRLPDDAGTMVWDERLDGYYAWAFPEPDDVINVGLTIPDTTPHAGHLRELFTAILDEHFGSIVLGGDAMGRWAGHPATVTTRVGRVATERSLLVGEAARLVCPGTVEGISFALQSGRLAAQTIARSFDMDHGLSVMAEQRYRLGLGARLLPTFVAGEGLHRIMRSSTARTALGHVVDPRAIASALSHFVGASSHAVPEAAPGSPQTRAATSGTPKSA